ncbi:hypothetical protein TPA0905_37170 [Streptomyces olivaceus]|nr:hypothetical protein TPA0905_37170 [Streptomyces olivaceus]
MFDAENMEGWAVGKGDVAGGLNCGSVQITAVRLVVMGRRALQRRHPPAGRSRLMPAERSRAVRSVCACHPGRHRSVRTGQQVHQHGEQHDERRRRGLRGPSAR